MQLHAVAERHGCSVVAEYIDHGISGAKSREQRPQFDALLHGVARREFDLIAAGQSTASGAAFRTSLLSC